MFKSTPRGMLDVVADRVMDVAWMGEDEVTWMYQNVAETTRVAVEKQRDRCNRKRLVFFSFDVGDLAWLKKMWRKKGRVAVRLPQGGKGRLWSCKRYRKWCTVAFGAKVPGEKAIYSAS
jgi:hypothetical protein